MNWTTWTISAADENGQPFFFFVYAQDRAGALAEVEDEIVGLRVIEVRRV